MSQFKIFNNTKFILNKKGCVLATENWNFAGRHSVNNKYNNKYNNNK